MIGNNDVDNYNDGDGDGDSVSVGGVAVDFGVVSPQEVRILQDRGWATWRRRISLIVCWCCGYSYCLVIVVVIFGIVVVVRGRCHLARSIVVVSGPHDNECCRRRDAAIVCRR